MDFWFSWALIPFLNWGPYVFGFIVIFLAAARRFSWGRAAFASYRSLVWVVAIFDVFYAFLETIGQYYLWASSPFTKLLLNTQADSLNILKDLSGKFFWIFNNRLGYFLFYSWGRFWLQIAVALFAAVAFYVFLLFLKKYKGHFFEEGETELGFLLSFLSGWPGFIIFLPVSFIFVVLVSAARIVFFKETHTTLGAPFILAAVLTIISENYIIGILNLWQLRT